MNKLSDKELQELLDKKLPVDGADKKDAAAYQLLFDMLNKKPSEGLSYGFSRNIANTIQAKSDRRIAFVWYIMVLVFIAASVAIAFLYLTSVDTKSASLYTSLFMKFKWVFFFGSGCFLAIEYLDRKLVKKV